LKKTLLILLLFTGLFTQAQIVNIPDATLKNILVTGTAGESNVTFVNLNSQQINDVDANNDGEIQLTEAQNILEFTVSAYDVQVVNFTGLESFTNLSKLWMFHFLAADFNTLNFSSLSNLQEILIANAYIPVLDLSASTNLEYLTLQETPVGNFILSGLNNLEIFQYIPRNRDLPNQMGTATIDFTGLSSLQRIVCFPGVLTDITLTGCTSLEYLSCSNNLLNQLDLSGLISLQEFDCINNNITSILDFSSTNVIKTIDCRANMIPEVILLNKPLLEILKVEDNQLTELNVGRAPVMRQIYCRKNLFNTLDFSEIPRNASIDIGESPLSFVNLKNGANYWPLITWHPNEGENNTPVYLCVDEGDEEFLRELLNSSITTFIIGNYCTFTPGGNYNTIQGAITFDADSNGCSATDAPIPFGKVQISDGTTTGNSNTNSGNYSFYTQAGTFTLTPQFENNYYTTASATVTFANNNNNEVTQNFCVTPNGVHPDVEVVIMPVLAAQPGFDAVYKILYKNKGNQTLSGNVALTYNDAVLDFVNASVAPASSVTGSLTWSYADLLPFQTREVIVTLNVNGPMEIPAVNLNDVLAFTANISPATGDETIADNTFSLDQTVIGTYDPNDISCIEGTTVNPDKIGEYLHYNINFENTGTAPATFIVVKDIVDAAKFDVSTLQVINASHALQTRVTGNKVEFIFDNINLPGEGKGNVTFKIKTLNTLAINSSVMQKADIYFDYNWPIETNEAITTFAILSADEFALDNSVTVSPNPANGVVNISAKAEIKSVQLYDVQGRLLHAGAGSTINVSNRAAGMYFVKVLTGKGMKVEKLIKQ
jgi:hypothetical protein